MFGLRRMKKTYKIDDELNPYVFEGSEIGIDERERLDVLLENAHNRWREIDCFFFRVFQGK